MFAALMLFNVLRMYMAMMPRAFSTVAQQQISEKRIAKFLQAEEFSVPQGTQRTEEPGLDGLGKGHSFAEWRVPITLRRLRFGL